MSKEQAIWPIQLPIGLVMVKLNNKIYKYKIIETDATNPNHVKINK